MTVCQLPPEALRVGHPLPFGLLDAQGKLLMARGSVIETATHRQAMIARGVYIDEADAESYRRAMAGKLDVMFRQNELLGRMAQARPDEPARDHGVPQHRRAEVLAGVAALQMRVGKLLREAPLVDGAARLRRLLEELRALTRSDADLALLVLIDAATSETHDYSVTHAMLVAVVCELAAEHLGAWPESWRGSLCGAALTMNLAMTGLQDALAQQSTPPDTHQRAQVDSHAERSALALQGAGIDDPLWLDAVRHHHASPPGPLADLPPAQQLARLIQRGDIFAARMSPRRKRAALSGAAAAKAAFLDEQGKPDEAGAAIIRATGIYPPGSFVRLASDEVAVVLRRGARANEPLVASVISRSGTPLGEPALRNTRLAIHAVAAGVAPQDVRVRTPLERLLRLL